MDEVKLEVSEGAPKKTNKQLEKEAKQREAYWRAMVSRGEVREMLNDMRQVLLSHQRTIQVLTVQVQSLVDVLIKHDITSMDELDGISAPYADEILKPVEQGTPSK